MHPYSSAVRTSVCTLLYEVCLRWTHLQSSANVLVTWQCYQFVWLLLFTENEKEEGQQLRCHINVNLLFHCVLHLQQNKAQSLRRTAKAFFVIPIVFSCCKELFTGSWVACHLQICKDDTTWLTILFLMEDWNIGKSIFVGTTLVWRPWLSSCTVWAHARGNWIVWKLHG